MKVGVLEITLKLEVVRYKSISEELHLFDFCDLGVLEDDFSLY